MLPEIREIKKRRNALGLTQMQLARLSGISQSLLVKTEAGRVIPSYDKVARIFEALDSKEWESGRKAEDVMYRGVISVECSDSLEKAVRLMKKNSISQMPVTENGKVVGSISEDSFLESILNKTLKGNDSDSLECFKVRDLMGESFATVGPKTPERSFLPLLKQSKAVLVMEKGEMEGIITKADLLGE